MITRRAANEKNYRRIWHIVWWNMSVSTEHPAAAPRADYRRPEASVSRGRLLHPRAQLPDEYLELLRSEAQHAIDIVDRRMDAAGKATCSASTIAASVTLANNMPQGPPGAAAFLFSELMADDLPRNARSRGVSFRRAVRHQVRRRQGHEILLAPGQRIRPPESQAVPHLLDSAGRRERGERHGVPAAVSRDSGIRTWVKHIDGPGYATISSATSARIAGSPLKSCRPGSIACFTSLNFHSSGPNMTNKMQHTYTRAVRRRNHLRRKAGANLGERRTVFKRRQERRDGGLVIDRKTAPFDSDTA